MAENDLDIQQELCEFVRDGRLIELDQYLYILSDQTTLLTTIIQQGNERFSLLMLAALHGHEDIVRLILVCSPTSIELEGSVYDATGGFVNHTTALWCALDRGHFMVASILIAEGEADINHGPTYPLLIDASTKGRLDIVKFLVDNGYSDVNETLTNDAEKYNSLILAACYGQENIVAYLLDRGAEMNYRTQHRQDTALTIAAREGHLTIIQMLCRVGASVTVKNLDGKTPMILAAERQAFEAIDFLLEYIHDETTFDDLELVASSFLAHSNPITFENRQQMVRLLRKSLEQRALFHVPKPVTEPIVVFDLQTECQTTDELDQIQTDNDRLCIEALLICERTLFVRKDIQLFQELFERRILMLVENKQFDRSFQLALHLSHLQQRMNAQTSVQHFIWIFCRMITAQTAIPAEQFLHVCHLPFEPLQQKTINLFIIIGLNLLTIAAKVLGQSTVSIDDRRSIVLWIRELCREKLTTVQGRNLLHLSVSSQTRHGIHYRSADINPVLSFPNVDTTRLLLNYGQQWIDVNAVERKLNETALHIVCRNSGHQVKGNVLKIIEILLSVGAHIDYANSEGQTPLDLATDTDIRAFLRSKQKISRLKCLCARFITMHKISYDQVCPKPTALNTFVQLHYTELPEEDLIDFGLFD